MLTVVFRFLYLGAKFSSIFAESSELFFYPRLTIFPSISKPVTLNLAVESSSILPPTNLAKASVLASVQHFLEKSNPELIHITLDKALNTPYFYY